jgi:hypothetical protein
LVPAGQADQRALPQLPERGWLGGEQGVVPAGRPEAEGDLIQHGDRLGRQRLACAGGVVEPLTLSSGKRGWGGGEGVAVPAGALQA